MQKTYHQKTRNKSFFFYKEQGFYTTLKELSLPGSFTSPYTTVFGDTENSPRNILSELHQNYPNPFTERTTLVFELNEESFVTIKIYSMLGEEIVTAVQQWFSKGKHSAELCASDVPAGVYSYRVTVEQKEGKRFFETKLMVKVK